MLELAALGIVYRPFFIFHLASAAALAISARRAGLNAAARATPPFGPPNFPIATA